MGTFLLSQFCFICILSTYYITSFTHVVYSQCLDNQKTLLLELKTELIFSSSVSAKLVQWNQTEDCCSWKGVECDDAGHAISLQLDNEMISGGIDNSSALFNLRYLEKLNLAYNDFNGVPIPRRIRNLTRLTHLNLSCSGFGGQVPFELSLLRRLVHLDLSFNHWGIPPVEIVKPNLRMLLQNLTLLRELYLDNVRISSQGSEWCQVISSSLPDLRELSLRNCDLSGPLDHSLSQLHFLSVLRLDRNYLSTSVPNFFANFSSLTTLSLSSCSLKGHFPEIIFQVPTLRSVDLSNNPLLNGTIPEFHQAGSLRTIVLANTSFSGSLPDSISNLTLLSDMKLSSCNFTGPIPSTVGNLTQLMHVDLSNNLFRGSIPSFQMSEKLAYVDLSNNLFNGPVPSFKMSKKLIHLDLSSNSFHSSVPSFQMSKKLIHVNLSNNWFSGSVPSFQMAKKLIHVDLSNNRFSGSVPSFQMSKKLTYINLSHNNLTGSLYSMHLDALSSLRHVNLGYNSINGSIPPSLFGLPLLKELQLSNNQLSGRVNEVSTPHSSNIQLLDLSGNKLEGPIPEYFFKLESLSTLSLSYNFFSGTVELEKFRGLRKLLRLELSYNNLSLVESSTNSSSSIFPQLCWLELASCNLHKLPDLIKHSRVAHLDLSNNLISGEVPSWIWEIGSGLISHLDLSSNLLVDLQKPCQLPNRLLVLDLSSNQFQGKLPLPCLCNFTSLQVLDLSINNFSGGIPDAIGDLSSLRVLDLSYNTLTGTIPKSMGNFTQLESLDLSMNQLTGEIPKELAELGFLAYLNLSYNKLVGMIPWGSQFATFSDDSFEGNIGLCGWPLQRSCNESEPWHEKSEIEWGVVSATLGYVVGLGSTMWLLWLCRSLRRKIFDRFDDVVVKIFDWKERLGRRVLGYQVNSRGL